MKLEEFEKLVEKAWKSIPKKFREKVDNLLILVKEEPDETALKLLKKRGGMILGYYKGVPFNRRGVHYSLVPPDTVVIFKNPLERISPTREELEAKVREVLLHEIGHYFGFGEEELRRMGCG